MPADDTEDADPLAALSARERQIAVALARGSSTAEIARRFDISTRTVESHLLHVYRKLGLHSRVELVLQIVRRDRQSS